MVEISDLIDKGETFLKKGQYDDALACFEQAILLDNNNPELWNLKAVSLRSVGRYDEAIECFNKSLEIDPRDRNAS